MRTKRIHEEVYGAERQDEFVPLPDYMIAENVEAFINKVNQVNKYGVKVTDVELSGNWGNQCVFAVPNDFKYKSMSQLKRNDICLELADMDGFTDGKVKFQLVITEFVMFAGDHAVSHSVDKGDMPMIIKNCTYTNVGTPDLASVQDVCDNSLLELA